MASKNELPAYIDIDDPQVCAGCHANVVEEWQQSMHSRAHRDNDPIFGAMLEFRKSKQGANIEKKCAKCHHPREPKHPESAIAKTGVSCATCHNVSAVHLTDGKVGVDALSWANDSLLRAGRDLPPGASPAHATGAGYTEIKDGTTLCLACHNKTKTPANQAACTTGPEFASHQGDDTCVSCHMPEKDGPVGAFGRQDKHRSHVFFGPHRAWYQDDDSILKQAIEAKIVWQANGVSLNLTNRSAHAFPSGFPGRAVYIQVVAYDDANNVVWKNFETYPDKNSKNAILNKVYHDENGKTVPAAFAKILAKDSRLKTNENRRIDFAMPKNTTRVEVRFLYRLLPAKLAKKLGLEGKVEDSAKVFLKLESKRP